MKFNKYIIEHRREEWKHFYIDYKRLKKYIKNFCIGPNILNDNFHDLINYELEKVNSFYKIIKEYDNDNEYLSDFIVLNYMSCFKLIKKYDKQCSLSNEYIKLEKKKFFSYISEIEFYKDFINSERECEETKLIIFDKDGTLIDHDSIFIEWIEKFGKNISKYGIDINYVYSILKYDSNERLYDFSSIVPRGTNDDIRNILQNHITSDLGYDADECKRIIKESWCEMELSEENTKPVCNLVELMCKIKERGIKIAINTSDDRKATEECIKILGINDYIDMIVCGDDIVSNKPSPESIWCICESLKINVKNSIMVGDTISDIHAGINARCGKVYGVLTGGYKNTELGDADKILENVKDILDI